MTRLAAFLRAVNLGGDTTLRMEELRTGLDAAGFGPAETILQSGNLVLRTENRDVAQIEAEIERLLDRRFGLRTEVFVRTSEEWRKVVLGNPFPTAARDDPSHLTVLLLKTPPTASAWAELSQGIPGREVVRAASRHGYVVYPEGIGRSRFTLDRIERTLGTRGTLRNWNTVLKVDALLTDG